MSNFNWGSGDAEYISLHSEDVHRNAEHKLIWAPLMFPKGPGSESTIRHADYGKGAPIIQVDEQLRTKKGGEIIIENVGEIYGQPIMGNGKAKDQKQSMEAFNMALRYGAARITPLTSEGKWSDKKSMLDFVSIGKKRMGSWASRVTEGAINAHLYGIAAPANAAVLRRLNLPSDCTTIFENAVVPFTYAGDKATDSLTFVGASNATDAAVAADTSAVLTASFFDTLQTQVTEDKDQPIDMVDLGDGSQGILTIIDGRGVEQLSNDPDYRQSAQEYRGPLNAILKRKLVKYKDFLFIEYANGLSPLANVGRGLCLGANALQFCRVMDWEYWEGVEDTHEWFNLLSVAGMFGCKATVFNNQRVNSHAFDYYKRA